MSGRRQDGCCGAELLVQCLENEGVSVVFGIRGEENIRLTNAVERSGIRYVLTRHEQASFMAEIYGGHRLGGGGVGAPRTGCDQPAARCRGGDDEQHAAVALSKRIRQGRNYKESHQFVDLVSMFAPVTKWSAGVSIVDAVREMVRKAVKTAETERPRGVSGRSRGHRCRRCARPAADRARRSRRRPQRRGHDDVVLVDIGALKMWMARLYSTYAANTCLISNGLSTMGFALPGALAKPGQGPRRCGCTQEIETAVREEIPLTVLIWEDDGYGLVRWKMDLEAGEYSNTSFTPLTSCATPKASAPRVTASPPPRNCCPRCAPPSPSPEPRSSPVQWTTTRAFGSLSASANSTPRSDCPGRRGPHAPCHPDACHAGILGISG
jgi:hypothetical protein